MCNIYICSIHGYSNTSLTLEIQWLRNYYYTVLCSKIFINENLYHEFETEIAGDGQDKSQNSKILDCLLLTELLITDGK